MPAPGLTVLDEGRVVRLRLDRPERLNALDDALRRALAEALRTLEDRPEVGVVLLEGAGRAFSAGADLTSTASPPVEGDWVTRRHRTGTWQRVLEHLDRIPQATVARLHGHVVGGAALLAAACDIRIASHDVVLRIPELAIGIPLTWAGIPLLVGRWASRSPGTG
jgi:enoyl-CoA hydratase/carnithine racemase